MRNPPHSDSVGHPTGTALSENPRRARMSETLAESVISTARAAHVIVEDLYVEEATRCRRTLSAPVPTVRLETAQESRETSLWIAGNQNGDARAWRTTSADEFSAAVGFPNDLPRTGGLPEIPPAPTPSPELRERLHQLLRDMQAVRGTVLQPSVTLTYGESDFAIRGVQERVRSGALPHFQLDLAATLRRNDTSVLWQHTLAGFREASLLEQLEVAQDPLADLRCRAEGEDAWPAPKGEFPVLWSPAALVEVLEPLLRTLEADQFLAGRSALGGESGLGENLAFAFSIEDEGAPDGTGGVDQEGGVSAPLLLVDRTGVRALATNAGLARMLGRPATGHARRSPGDGGTSPVLWRPRVEGLERNAHLPGTLNNGIAIRQCSVVVKGTEATLHVHEARLMHGGVVGERIQPFCVATTYPELLASLRAFGERTVTVGRLRWKHGQRWLTEWQVPEAASLRFPVPGSVPADHYW